jgi:hypothetical protein
LHDIRVVTLVGTPIRRFAARLSVLLKVWMLERIKGEPNAAGNGMGTVKMRHILFLGIVCLAGCQSTIGPFAPRSPQRVDDPQYSIAEQESRGRDRFALPDDYSRQAGPPSGNAYPLGR